MTDPFTNTDTTVTDPFANTDTTVTDPFANTNTAGTDYDQYSNDASGDNAELEGLFAMCDSDFSSTLTQEEFEYCYRSYCATLMLVDPTETCESDPVEQLMGLYDAN